VLRDLLSEVSHLDERIKQYDKHIHAMAKDCTAAQQLMQLMGVGETTATAIVAMVGDARARVRPRAAGRRGAAHQPIGASRVLQAHVFEDGLDPCAVTSAAHKLARLICTMLTKGEEYTDQGQA